MASSSQYLNRQIVTVPSLQKKGLDLLQQKCSGFAYKVAQELNSVGELYLTMRKKKKEKNGEN